MNSVAAKVLFDAAVAGISGRLLESRGWTMHSRVWPTLDLSFRHPERQELRVRMNCDDWNDTPPSVDLLAPDGHFLTALPTQRPGATSPIFNGSAHHLTTRPFVCMVGVREYHNHPSHVSDVWSNFKHLPSYSLGEIVTQLWRGWEKSWP